jgi:hypothetical protein
MIISIDADHMVYRHSDTLADDTEKLQALYDENRVILRIGGVLRRAEVYDWVGNSKHPVSFPLGWCRVEQVAAPVADAADRAMQAEPDTYEAAVDLLEAAMVEQVNEALRLISQVEPALRVAAAGRKLAEAECERLRARVAELEGEGEVDDWKRVSLDLEALWSALGFQWAIDEAREDLLPRKGTNTD